VVIRSVRLDKSSSSSSSSSSRRRRSTAEYTTVVESSRVESRNWEPQKWQEMN
jgi:hypothetical protein